MLPIQRMVASGLARRSRFPRWLNSAIDRAVDRPPRFLWNRLSPLARAAAPGEIPDPPRPPQGAAERIVIGPVNYSGQGYAWARALERARRGAWVHVFAIEVPGGFAFPVDAEVPMHVHASSREWQEAQLAALARCTHALVEAERPLLGRRFVDFEAEARALRALGLSVACIAHGTDIRVPSEHLETTEWSHFADPDFYAGREETLARRNIAALLRLGGPLFVSTPDLLRFLPEAAWCPVVVDSERWRADPPGQERGRPVVAFSPSNPKVKGSDLVEPVLQRLHGEGVIDYRPIRGVPSGEMPRVYADADIVLDQFRLGSYGVAACEAMAAGRVVVGHVIGEVREAVARETGLRCPIVEATPDTLEGVLRELAADGERRVRLGAEGRAFVEEVHDGRLSARVLGERWLDRTEPHADPEPRVDVVIATHTPARPVRRAVASVLDRTVAPVRVTVVVHNTDPEPIRQALSGYVGDPRLRIVPFTDGVHSPAGPMNHGLSLATAPFSSLLGSDDEFAPGAIDRWLELAERHAAAAVIARIDFSHGGISPQPPVRPRRLGVRHPVRDRLAYRSAPLGLVSTRHFGELRLAEGFATGEDIAYSLQLWFSGHPVVFAGEHPGYVLHTEGDDRVTRAPRPAVDELAYLPGIVGSPWFRSLGASAREAIVVKLLRVQLLGAVGLRGADISAADREGIRAARALLVAAAPTAERRLSRAECALLDAVTAADADPASISEALAAWRRRFSRRGVLTRSLLGLPHPQAPLRYGAASLLLARRR